MIGAGPRHGRTTGSSNVATNDSTGPGDEAVEGSWSPRRSTSSRAKASSSADQSTDPTVLAGEIEKTREELAETLDAIADKVSPKKVADRTKKKVTGAVKDGANDAVTAVKQTAEAAQAKAAEVAGTAKEKATEATATAKEMASDAKDRVSGTGGSDPDRSPLTPATSVEIDSASPLAADTTSLPGAEVPYEPAPTPGALADAAVVSTEPPGAESWTPSPRTTPAPSNAPMLAGAGAALLVLLLVLRRRKR